MLFHYVTVVTGSMVKRQTIRYEEGLTYGDLFPGYPSDVKMHKDVAEFVSFTQHSAMYCVSTIWTLFTCPEYNTSDTYVLLEKYPILDEKSLFK